MVRSARKRYFSAALMEKFVKDHKAAFPEEKDGEGLDMSGNPD